MADNVTIPAQGTGTTTPVVRTKDRSGIETQVVGLDVNPGGSTEQLMTSPDSNLPARISDVEAAIRSLVIAIANPPGRDSLGRLQCFINGGLIALSAGTLTTVTTITNPVNQTLPGGCLPPAFFQPLSQIAWADAVRQNIT